MKINKIGVYFILLLFCSNFIFAGCGGCPGDNATLKKEDPPKKPVGSTLVMSMPDDGNINGLVITSCGKCNLGTKDKGCSLSVKIGDKIYPVEGTGIHDHGDAHDSVGFCSAVRVAWAKGKMKKNVFHAETFFLVGDSQ